MGAPDRANYETEAATVAAEKWAEVHDDLTHVIDQRELFLRRQREEALARGVEYTVGAVRWGDDDLQVLLTSYRGKKLGKAR